MKTMIALLSVALLSACAYFQPVADKVGDAVKDYCKQPLEARKLVRAQVNQAAAPNVVQVTCFGDPA